MIMRLLPACCLVLVAVTLAACTATRSYVASGHRVWQDTALPPASEQTYQVFLLGEVGGPASGVLPLLRTHLLEAGENSAVVFLGDTVSPGGLPDSAAADRADREQHLTTVLETVNGFAGRIVFLPGDGDWSNGDAEGRDAVARLEQFVEQHLGAKNTFRPDDGFPGPEEITLTDDLRLVVLGTQWWLHPYDKAYGDAGDYDIDEDADFLVQLDDLIKKNRRRRLLVVGHHALFSNGRHGGFFPARDHLFPLARVMPGAYLPLPLLGSVYPLYARFIGGRQHLAHARYRSLHEGLEARFRQHEGLIYASAHDHNLQYFHVGQQHYLVSGAGSQTEPVARGHGATFTSATPGFMTLSYYEDGSVWMEAHGLDADGATGRVLFRTRLEGPAADRVDPGVVTDGEPLPDYADSTRTVIANPDLAAGGLKRFFWGANRRDVWTTPVEAPYLDLGREAGGLTPIKRGGGLQSTSLRLQGADGKEYVLRSIRKDPSKALPEDLRKTLVGAISRDLSASQHPYGAYVVAPLADAAGVYHANPRLVYVPNDPRLGVYRGAVGGQLMLFEERPNDDMSDAPHFGNAREVVGAPSMYRAVTADNDHRVDGRALARARLFDMLLSDWDRHVDQWRWAAFEVTAGPGTHTIYRPIPRDRDLVFNRFNGLFPGLSKRFTKYQDFRPSYGNLRGLTFNAWEQDHRFLAGLDRSDWVEIADSIRAELTDAVIEDALRRWPDPIYALTGEEVAAVLKARRDKLTEVAETFYGYHAASVDVVGSNKHERFEVRRLNDDETEVVVVKIRKDGEVRRELFRRTFHRNETREILLYGLDGDDRFEITGEVGKGILVAAIGGPGEDHFTDASRVGGLGKKTRFYDTTSGNTWSPGPEAKVIRSDDPAVHQYDQTPRSKLAPPLPPLVFGSDSDDGLILGTGLSITRHRLRKHPYAVSHLLLGSYALGTKAVTVSYAGHWVADLGGWDVTLYAHWKNPDNTFNFFGFGNETPYDGDDREGAFNQARLRQLAVAPGVMKKTAGGLLLRLGAHLEGTTVKRDLNRFIGQQPEALIAPRTFETQWYAGLDASLTLGETDRLVNPKQGILWTNTATLNIGVQEAEGAFGTVGSELTLYVSPSLSPQVTLAARAGVAHTEGDFPFYYANVLGGRANLRGYRNERFSGRTSAYQNVEVRLGLAQYASILALGEFGVLGFFDNGRVWYDGTASRQWHTGYGGGLWATLFGAFALTGTVGFSEEDTFFKVETGFLF